jgi:amidohydrolase
MQRFFFGLLAFTLLISAPARAQDGEPPQMSEVELSAALQQVMPRVIAWRRDLHAHPELTNQETRTAALVARELRRLNFDVRTGVGGTGVVGVLRGGQPGPVVVALRAEMDALPVHEATGLPFASRVQADYNGERTYVAHACGHDLHIAMLLGAANVLAGRREQLRGTVVFIFQPGEEGGDGAEHMIGDGVLENPAPSVIFGLHVVPGAPGTIFYRPEGFMAAADEMHIELHGRQTHGAWPWLGIDLASLSSAIVSELNTVAARTVNVTRTPTVISVTAIASGNRWNIIPGEATLQGTLRTFDDTQRAAIQQRITNTVSSLAQMYGATAETTFHNHANITFNDPALTHWAQPALQEAVGIEGDVDPNRPPTTVGEDFSNYQRRIPGLFVHLGSSANGEDPATSAPNHSPGFSPNESILPLGVRAHVLFAVRYLENGGLNRRAS